MEQHSLAIKGDVFLSEETKEQIRQIVREEIAAHEERQIEATLNEFSKRLREGFITPDHPFFDGAETPDKPE